MRSWPKGILMKILWLGILPALSTGSVTVHAQGTSPHYRLHISAQTLNGALKEFASETGLQVARLSEIDQGAVVTNPVVGEFTASQALDTLLAGTQLTYRIVNDHTIAIVRSGAMRPIPPPPPAAPSVPNNNTNSEGTSNMSHKGFLARFASLFVACGLATAGHPACAQTAAAEPARTASSGGSLDEILVTAEKKSESASKTPVALSAFSGETLKTAGVVSVADIENIAPGVTMGRDNFGVNINIRGVTSTDNTSKGDQGIAFNVDGIPIGRPIEEGLSFFDVNRVEVLRGPQGTLYGKSSTGGAINVITNKPTNMLEANGDIEFGTYNARRENAVVNIPMTDKFAIRVAVNANDRDGYLKPADGSATRNDEHDRATRISARYGIAPNTSLLLTFTGGTVGGVGQTQAVFATVVNNSGAAQRNVYGNPFGGHINDSFHNFNAEFNADAGPVHFTYDGARLHYNAQDLTSSVNDPYGNGPAFQPGFFPPVPFPGPPASYAWRDYRGDFTTDSHEIRLANAAKSPLDWVLGANWYREEIHESDHFWLAPYADPTLANSVNSIDPVNTTTHTTYGVFGQATWHITDVWGLVLGLRDAHDDVSRAGTFAAPWQQMPSGIPWPDPEGNACHAPNDCIGEPNDGKESASKLTYRAGINAQLTPSNLLYASVATGYKAGGFNDFATAANGATYDPEAMTAYELGYKGFAAANVRFNSAAFYYDYSSDQISSLIYVGPSPVLATRSAATTIYGWENEVTARLAPNDIVDGSLAFEKSQYTRFLTGALANVDFSGKSLDKTPAAVLNLGYSHTFDLAGGSNLQVRIGTKYSTSYVLSDFVNATQYRQQSYSRSDLTANWTSADDKLTVQGYVHNIEDKMQAEGYTRSTVPSVVNGATAAVSEPRMIGVRIGFKW
jgi:iron complex outermembrane receptor protein